MNQRDADPAALIGQVDLSNARPDIVSEPPTRRTEEEPEFELQELLDYMPVPLRPRRTRLVRFRQGARLRPLPYSLDEENP
jgi:hypothetical protein